MSRAKKSAIAAIAFASAAYLFVSANVAQADESGTDIPQFSHEPMDTQVKSIDGTNILYQYGEPVPDFDATYTQNQEGRQYVSLDGQWKFNEDPSNVGASEQWYSTSYDDSGWSSEPVPGSWDLYNTPGFGSEDGSTYGQGTAFYDGYAWFRRHVNVDANWRNQFVKLNFLSVDYLAWVYVNGQQVGVHEGSGSAFSLDVSKYLQPGKDNVIAVRVYRRPTYDSYTSSKPNAITATTEVPYKPVDYWPYAGITRGVYLEATSNVTVSKVLTTTGDHTLTADVILYNHGDTLEDRQLVVDPGAGTGATPQTQEVSLNPGEVKVVQLNFSIPDAQWWSPATPVMYQLKATLYKGKGQGQVTQNGLGSVDDSLTTGYGMRTISVANAELQLNGKQVFLKGVNWHEEMPDTGRSMTIPEYDELLGKVLDLHANFIRNSVYPRDPYVYDYADSHGIMVMDDTQNMWLNWQEEQLQTQSYGLSRSMALTMAWNEVNHPSVILWGLQNESDIWSNQSVYRAWIADMKQAVKSVDIQNRPVTWASGSSWDPAFDLADVIGFNEYFGYFYGKDSDLGKTLDQVHNTYPNKPILITENGTWSTYGNHGSPTQGGTEEWQSQDFLNHWNQVVSRTSFMAGYTYWVLKDYKERDNYNQSFNGISTMGLMTFDLKPRLVYQTFKNAANPIQ